MIVDEDECKIQISDCHQKCLNTIGGFYCVCYEGFHLSGSNKCIKGTCSLSVSLSHDFDKCKHYIYICSLRIWIPGNSARQYLTNKQDKNAAISFLIVDEVSSQCLGVADTCQYGCRVEGPRAFCYCPLGYTLNPDQTTCTCMSLYNQYLIITVVQGQAILICYQCNLLYPVV